MTISVVLYDYDDNDARRAELRATHREFLFAHPALLASGPTSANGAVIVFEAEPAELEAYMDDDPFWTAGVVARRTVTTWDVVGGSWKAALGL
jgi:uncharacterized protein